MSAFKVNALIYHKGSIMKGGDGDYTFTCSEQKCLRFDIYTGFASLEELIKEKLELPRNTKIMIVYRAPISSTPLKYKIIYLVNDNCFELMIDHHRRYSSQVDFLKLFICKGPSNICYQRTC